MAKSSHRCRPASAQSTLAVYLVWAIATTVRRTTKSFVTQTQIVGRTMTRGWCSGTRRTLASAKSSFTTVTKSVVKGASSARPSGFVVTQVRTDRPTHPLTHARARAHTHTHTHTYTHMSPLATQNAARMSSSQESSTDPKKSTLGSWR